MSTTANVAVVGLLVAIATGLGGYAYGMDQGRNLEKGHQDALALQALSEQVHAHADLVKQSGAASRAMRVAAAGLQRTNDTTTKELNHELSQTADRRVGCVFPSGVLRNLSAARDRAAQAATSGIRLTVPSTASITGDER